MEDAHLGSGPFLVKTMNFSFSKLVVYNIHKLHFNFQPVLAIRFEVILLLYTHSVHTYKEDSMEGAHSVKVKKL